MKPTSDSHPRSVNCFSATAMLSLVLAFGGCTFATSFAGICEVIITDISGLTTVNRLHPIDHASCYGSFTHGSRHTGRFQTILPHNSSLRSSPDCKNRNEVKSKLVYHQVSA